MKKLCVLAMLAAHALGSGQIMSPSHRKIFSSACSVPGSVSNRWMPSAACGSGTTCMADSVGSNPALGVASHVPTYSATGGPNSTASIATNGTSQYMSFTSIAIPTTLSILMVVKPGATGSGQVYFAGPTASLSYGINNTQMLRNTTSGVLGTGSSSHATGSWWAIGIDYNTSTGAGKFYNLSGGSATADGTFTSTSTLSNGFQYMGTFGSIVSFATVSYAEIDYSATGFSSADWTALAGCVKTNFNI